MARLEGHAWLDAPWLGVRSGISRDLSCYALGGEDRG